jgi:hypothetical protein
MFASDRNHDETNQFKPDQEAFLTGTYTLRVSLKSSKILLKQPCNVWKRSYKVKFKVTERTGARSGSSRVGAS